MNILIVETEDTYDRFYLAGKNTEFSFDDKTQIKAFDENTEWYFPLPDEIALRMLMYSDDAKAQKSSESSGDYSQKFLINEMGNNFYYHWNGPGSKDFGALNRLGVFLREIGNPGIAKKYLKLLS